MKLVMKYTRGDWYECQKAGHTTREYQSIEVWETDGNFFRTKLDNPCCSISDTKPTFSDAYEWMNQTMNRILEHDSVFNPGTKFSPFVFVKGPAFAKQ